MLLCNDASAVGGGRGKKDEEDTCDLELSHHVRMIAPHYWLPGLPGSGVTPASPPLWYPYLPSYYGPQAAAAAAAAAAYHAGGYKLVPDSATGHCYIIPGQ